MDIAWLRDLIICISGILVIVLLILLTILVVVIYRKSKSVLQSVEATSKNLRDISSVLQETFCTPFAGMGTFIQGISKAVTSFNKTIRKK